MFRIVEEPIDVGALVTGAFRPDCGAVAIFIGTTRVDENSGASVEYLEYEAYRPMADRKLEEIGAEIRERWEVREVSIVHRLGRVDPGEPSVVIVVVGPRRGPAFQASRYASYSRNSTLASEASSARVVPMKVATAPQSGRKAPVTSAPMSMGSSTIRNKSAPRDRWQHGHFVTGGDPIVHPGVLAVDGKR